MNGLQAVFGTAMEVAWWQECLRAIVIFVYGLLLLRCSGRRTFGRWSALDIVISIVFGSSLSRALTGNAPFAGTIAAMTVLIALHWILGRVVAASRRLSAVFEGAPVELARGGARHEARLASWSVSRADLEEALRGSGIEDLAHARFVMLEPSGKITVVKG
jgi:uncharacterized membrane protein YcaP (DUF421 family)